MSMAGTNRALAPGTQVYKYWIEKSLGEGGFGITYKVTDKLGKVYAMKEFFPDRMAYRDPKSNAVIPRDGYAETFGRFRDKFLNEAQLIFNYQSHPNIIDVYKRFDYNNTAYYVMEYLDGSDLKGILKSHGGCLPWDYLQPLMERIVSALATVHRDRIYHCDISPDNIFVLNDGSAILIDFGAAKGALSGESSEVFLKPGFAPPEQMEFGGNIGPWTDIYALAVTIYRAYTGKMPPKAAERCLDDRTIWPSQMGLHLPSDSWEYALRRAMAVRVEDRYHDVEEFWRDLAGPPPGSGFVLEGLQGHYRGQKIPVESVLMFGRDTAQCSILFPVQTPGVSSRHLRVWAEGNSLYAMDMNSTYGTFLGNTKMRPGLCYTLKPEDTLFFGANQMFRVTKKDTITTFHIG